jgi:beta-lactam-binding protein with PASTA domain
LHRRRRIVEGVQLSRRFAALAAALVVATPPAAGSAAARHEASAAPERVRVPDIVGKRLRQAEYLVKQAGLRIGFQSCSCTFGIGVGRSYVCVQRPRAGAVVPRGTAVSTFSARARSDC